MTLCEFKAKFERTEEEIVMMRRPSKDAHVHILNMLSTYHNINSVIIFSVSYLTMRATVEKTPGRMATSPKIDFKLQYK